MTSGIILKGAYHVEIPVENVKPGTVAVIVKADGTEEIVKTSTIGKNGVVLTLDAGATVKLVDDAPNQLSAKRQRIFERRLRQITEI